MPASKHRLLSELKTMHLTHLGNRMSFIKIASVAPQRCAVLREQTMIELETDLLIDNATLWASAEVVPHTGWMRVRGGTIHAIGDDTTKRPVARNVLTLDGHHVIPSFVDCHTHLSVSSWVPLAGDASNWNSKEDALRGVRHAAQASPEHSWLVFMLLDYANWPGRRYPTAAELEEASGGRKVLLVDVSLHRALASESVLERCGFTRQTADPHGDLTRDRSGRLTGELWEALFSEALDAALTDLAGNLGPEGLGAMLDREAERHLACGVTDAHDPAVNRSIMPLVSALNRRSPLRLSWSVSSDKGFLHPVQSEDFFDDVDPDYGAGPPSAKVFADGAERCAICLDSAAILTLLRTTLRDSLKHRSLDPFRDMLSLKSAYKSGQLHTEYLRYDIDALDAKLHQLSEKGLRLKVHALGNVAAVQAIDSISRLRTDQKVTVEHLSILHTHEVEALSKSGAIASVQPGFIPHYGPALLRLGEVPNRFAIPVRAFLNAGVPFAISSDSPCGPLDPLFNIRCAVERQTSDGRILNEGEALTESQALKAATVNGMLGITGKAKQGLEPGAPADFAICTGHPFKPSTRVSSTWIDGRTVWQDK